MKKKTRGRKPYRKISDYKIEIKELKAEREELKAKMERLYLVKLRRLTRKINILETCLSNKEKRK